MLLEPMLSLESFERRAGPADLIDLRDSLSAIFAPVKSKVMSRLVLRGIFLIRGWAGGAHKGNDQSRCAGTAVCRSDSCSDRSVHLSSMSCEIPDQQLRA